MADTGTGTTTLSGWARISDYLFGRNTLIGIASFMLLIIAGYATWHGMRDFIVGVSSTPVTQGEGLSISNDVLVIAVVVALTFLMWLALRETFGAQRRITERLITFPLYLFLALWSIGFGYGFWWSLIAGEEATRTGLSGLQEDARDAGSVVSARLEAVRLQLDSVVNWSESQMQREETSGGSCGTSSGAGRGPLYNARRSVRDGVANLRDGFTRSWLQPVQADIELLQQSVAGLQGTSVEERQKQFEAKASEIRGKARSIAARSNELGKSTATEMRSLAASVSTEPGRSGSSCYDPTLAERLKQAADQADQPAQLKLREAVFNEGPAGVANAIKKLWENIGAYMSSLVSYVFSGGQESGDHTTSGEPITGRDMIALLATIGIDIGLLALAALTPSAAGPVREDGLAATQSEIHLPNEAVIQHLTTAMETAIDRAPGVSFEWIRRHFIHHGGSSYFVIPNLYNVTDNEEEERRALAMNQLAGVFDDLKLVVALSEKELKRFGDEERRHSFSDLNAYRGQNDAAQPDNGETHSLWQKTFGGKKPEAVAVEVAPTGDDTAPRLRNHGLLSKAQRTLDIAKWSPKAQSDVEIFRLVDTEGLTPLLTVLNKASLAKGSPKRPIEAEGPAQGGALGEPQRAIGDYRTDKT
ncbi:MAG: hypothetical protein Q7T86_18855 [Hyphomicrobiaceae bacterium]|nr:hypothetical protein [Hyphomicrobiaceae bacterium]